MDMIPYHIVRVSGVQYNDLLYVEIAKRFVTVNLVNIHRHTVAKLVLTMRAFKIYSVSNF